MTCLGGQDDQQAAEDIDKVQEEVYGVPDVVITAAVELLHNELCVKQHKPTEEQQTKVQLKLGGRGSVIGLKTLLCTCTCIEYHRKVHLKRNRMAQISAPYHLQVRSYDHLKSTAVTTFTMYIQ